MKRIPVLRRGTLDPRPWSADEGEWTATRGSRVNGLHCTFKRPPLLWLSPFRVLHYPRVVLCRSPRLFSEMTNECPILRGSQPRPPCPLSAITPRSRVTHTPDSSNILLIFIFHKTNWRRTRRINSSKRRDIWSRGKYLIHEDTRLYDAREETIILVINAL